jgi:hypothetical protein
VQVGWGAGCFRRSGGSGGKGAASVVLGDLSVRRGARAPISGSRRVRRSCFSEARRGVTLQPARQGDRHPPCTCCYIVFLCESRPVLALRAVQCFFRPLRAFPVAAGWEEDKLNPRFFRGQRVLARYMRDTTVMAGHTRAWYAGAVIGKGNLIGTYELLFDPCEANGFSKKDYHRRTPPFAGPRDGTTGLASGTVAVKLPKEDA